MHIQDRVVRVRLTFVAGEIEKFVRGKEFASYIRHHDTWKLTEVPEFDRPYIALHVQDVDRTRDMRTMDHPDMCRVLREKAEELLPYLRLLFGADYKFWAADPRRDPRKQRSWPYYMPIVVEKNSANW